MLRHRKNVTVTFKCYRDQINQVGQGLGMPVITDQHAHNICGISKKLFQDSTNKMSVKTVYT